MHEPPATIPFTEQDGSQYRPHIDVLQAIGTDALATSSLQRKMIGPRVIVVKSRLVLAPPLASNDVITYRYFETVSRRDQNSWGRFLKSLTSQLSDSALGSVPDRATSKDDSTTSDLLVELRNIDYGRALLEECVRKDGISIQRPIAPERWTGYRCDEYFDENWWSPEKYDRESHLWAGIPESHLWNGVFDYTCIYEDFALMARSISALRDGCHVGCLRSQLISQIRGDQRSWAAVCDQRRSAAATR